MSTSQESMEGRLTAPDFLGAMDALLTGNAQLIQTRWPDRQLTRFLWRTFVLADADWMASLGGLITATHPSETAGLAFGRRMKELRWDAGCNAGCCWMRISLGTRCVVEAERRWSASGLAPQMSPFGNNYAPTPWTKWTPIHPLRHRDGRVDHDFPTEEILGTL